MIDDETLNHIKKVNDINNTPQAKELAMILGKTTQEIASIIDNAYKTHEEFGNAILSSVLTSLTLANSKNIDQAIERLDKVYKHTKRDLIQLDKDINTK